jgi:2-dehydropantoate 2-reductase
MKILVFGAGVLGSLYAARPQQAGHTVTILARGQRLQELHTQGLILENAASGERQKAEVKVIDALAPQETFDWALVVVRKNQLATALAALAAHPGTPNVLFLVNNAAGPAELAAALGSNRVIIRLPASGQTSPARWRPAAAVGFERHTGRFSRCSRAGNPGWVRAAPAGKKFIVSSTALPGLIQA